MGSLVNEDAPDQTLKLSPHPHVPFTFGLLNLNPSLRPSLVKSTSVPSRYARFELFTITLTPWLSNTRSSGPMVSAYSTVYALPEQPTVFTPMRRPSPFPRLPRKDRTRSAAFSVRRSVIFNSSLQTTLQIHFLVSRTSGVSDVSPVSTRQYTAQRTQKFLDVGFSAVPTEADTKTAARQITLDAHRQQYRTRLIAAPRARRSTRHRKSQAIQVQYQSFALHTVDTKTNRVRYARCVGGKNLHAMKTAEPG